MKIASSLGEPTDSAKRNKRLTRPNFGRPHEWLANF